MRRQSLKKNSFVAPPPLSGFTSSDGGKERPIKPDSVVIHSNVNESQSRREHEQVKNFTLGSAREILPPEEDKAFSEPPIP